MEKRGRRKKDGHTEGKRYGEREEDEGKDGERRERKGRI